MVMRTRLVAVAVVSAAVASAAGFPTAQAATGDVVVAEREAEVARRLASQPARIELGQRLLAQLGSRAAGMWLDQDGDTVVNVLDEQAAATVRAAGGAARVVERDATELAAIHDALTGTQVADTAVGIDVSANQVLVRVGESAANLSGMLATARGFGDAVRIEYVDSFSTHISGGSAIGAIQGEELDYCTLGFSVTAPPGMLGNAGLTAGHCTAMIPQWWEGFVWYYGPSVTADFPGDDFGLIANWGLLPQPGNVYRYDGTYQDITSAARPEEGMAVCLSGATTGPGSGLSCGTVTALEQRVCYQSGDCVEGMAETNAPGLKGDSGGPWFAGPVAVGLHSGGNITTSYFQPVVEALERYGVQLL